MSGLLDDPLVREVEVLLVKGGGEGGGGCGEAGGEVETLRLRRAAARLLREPTELLATEQADGAIAQEIARGGGEGRGGGGGAGIRGGHEELEGTDEDAPRVMQHLGRVRVRVRVRARARARVRARVRVRMRARVRVSVSVRMRVRVRVRVSVSVSVSVSVRVS